MTIKVTYSFLPWIFYDLDSVLDKNQVRLKWKMNIYNYKHKNIKESEYIFKFDKEENNSRFKSKEKEEKNSKWIWSRTYSIIKKHMKAEKKT